MTEILTDGIILEKNLILLKNLNGLDRNELGGKEPVFIDVWPVSILDSDQILTDGHFDFDESSLFLLQLGKYQIPYGVTIYSRNGYKRGLTRAQNRFSAGISNRKNFGDAEVFEIKEFFHASFTVIS